MTERHVDRRLAELGPRRRSYSRAPCWALPVGSLAEAKALHINRQDGKCAICEARLSKPHLDHCHQTGYVRGVLCPNCNVGIGHFRDNPELLHKAVAYLERTRDEAGPTLAPVGRNARLAACISLRVGKDGLEAGISGAPTLRLHAAE